MNEQTQEEQWEGSAGQEAPHNASVEHISTERVCGAGEGTVARPAKEDTWHLGEARLRGGRPAYDIEQDGHQGGSFFGEWRCRRQGQRGSWTADRGRDGEAPRAKSENAFCGAGEAWAMMAGGAGGARAQGRGAGAWGPFEVRRGEADGERSRRLGQ
ncbi:hypothetical protein ERJ75_000473200 [Trypanosoma vivax]|nr:hypothetical protein ERJ75_000473200 [Trypanosoma vivax]